MPLSYSSLDARSLLVSQLPSSAPQLLPPILSSLPQAFIVSLALQSLDQALFVFRVQPLQALTAAFASPLLFASAFKACAQSSAAFQEPPVVGAVVRPKGGVLL